MANKTPNTVASAAGQKRSHELLPALSRAAAQAETKKGFPTRSSRPPPTPSSTADRRRRSRRLEYLPLEYPVTPVGTASTDDPLVYEDFTDVDEVTHSSTNDDEWALEYVKSERLASSFRTQYWSFKQDAENESPHVELKVHTEALGWDSCLMSNFDFLLSDVKEVSWSADTLKVKIDSINPLMAEFKRERTKRRFVSFCEEQNLHTTKRHM